jgi:hypothetical protein
MAYSLAETSPVLARQKGLLQAAIDNAMELPVPRRDRIELWVSQQRAQQTDNSGYVPDYGSLQFLREYVLKLTDYGLIDCALAWGRCVYIADRRFGHCWLNLLPVLVAAKVFGAAEVRVGDALGQPPDEASAIPPRILQYWDKPVSPPDVQVMIASWRSTEGFSHRLVDDSEARAFLDGRFGARVREAYDRITHVCGKSDLFRLAWLYEHGGIYVDVDERRHGPLVALLPAHSDLVLTWSRGIGSSCVNNWFIAVAPRHRLIGKALQMAISRVEICITANIKMNTWQQTGPGVMSTVVLDDWAVNGQLADAFGLTLFSEPEFRKIVVMNSGLDYKKGAEGNWRMRPS